MDESTYGDVKIRREDGHAIVARYFTPREGVDPRLGVVIIAPATGVHSRYYWRFADYLAKNGFGALAFDYRGIGRSAPERPSELRNWQLRWHEWGTLDTEACISWAREREGADVRLSAVGHSFGGFAVTLARQAVLLDRILMVGAQHAHWPDYDARLRRRLWLKWHVFMPAVAVLWGYFPGKRFGWLENLPRGVALDWARAAADYAAVIGPEGADILRRAGELRCAILSVAPTDDPYATEEAVRRTLSYFPHADAVAQFPRPADYGVEEIGHFGVFHQRFEATFWDEFRNWLSGGSAARQPGAGAAGVERNPPDTSLH